MKIRFYKFQNWIILSLMGLLGLNACHSEKNISQTPNKTATPIENGDVVSDNKPSTKDYSPIDDAAVPDTIPTKGKPIIDTIETRPDDSQVICLYGVQPRDFGLREKVEEPTPLMYGVPTIDFKVKGRVLDSKGAPVKGLQVVLLNNEVDVDLNHIPQTEYMNEYFKKSADTTDVNGSFECVSSDRPWETLRLMVRDVDGKKNNTYQGKIIKVEFAESETPNAMDAKEKTVTVTVNRKD